MQRKSGLTHRAPADAHPIDGPLTPRGDQDRLAGSEGIDTVGYQLAPLPVVVRLYARIACDGQGGATA